MPTAIAITAAVQAEYLPQTGSINPNGAMVYEAGDAAWIADALAECDGLLVSTIHQLAGWGRWTRLVRFASESRLAGTYWLIAD